RHGVLGPFAGTAAVGEGEGTRVVQEGPGVRGHDERLDRQRRQAWTAEVRSLVGAEELAVLTSDDRAADPGVHGFEEEGAGQAQDLREISVDHAAVADDYHPIAALVPPHHTIDGLDDP